MKKKDVYRVIIDTGKLTFKDRLRVCRSVLLGKRIATSWKEAKKVKESDITEVVTDPESWVKKYV